MKRVFIVSIVAASLAVGALGGRWWAKHSVAKPVMAEATAGDVLYWYDPMVPQTHFDKPGKSPFMDMQLVPKYAQEAGKSSGVQIEASLQQNLGVRLATVERIDLASRIDASGVLGFNERDVAVVQSRAAGFVEKVWPMAPGDRVKVGDPLAQVVLPEWAAAEQEALAVRLSGDRELVDAARDRLRLLGIDAAEIKRLEASGVANTKFVLRAPINGVVQALEMRAGMALVAGQTLLRINGLDSVWLEVAVPEALGGSVHVGDPVEVQLESAGTPSVKGRVSALVPALNDATRTLRVRVELANRDGALRPGQSAQVQMNGATGQSALAVPTEAVIRTGKRSVVMLAQNGGFRPVEVLLGPEIGERTVIASGLTEGQQVVSSGQFLLDSEASLRGLGSAAMKDEP